MAPIAIIVTRPEHVDDVLRRVDGSTVRVLSDEDSLHILERVLSHRPTVLALHQGFASTSRGAMLVAEIKAEPALLGTELRVLIEDEDTTPLLLSEMSLQPEDALVGTSRPLDRAGTRQAARYAMGRRVVAVNGEPAQLIDLSLSGAQVQLPVRLRIGQLVRVVLPEASGGARCQGTVVWSIAVPGRGVIEYRAGMEFIGPDQARLSAYLAAFGGAAEPDPTQGLEP